MSDKDLIFHPSTQRHPFKYIGVLDSEHMDALADEVATDITEISAHHNALVALSRARRESAGRDIQGLLERIRALEEGQAHSDYVGASAGVKLRQWVDYHNAGPITYLSGAASARMVQIATSFGHATIPMNAIESRFYGTNLVTGAIVPSEGLSVAVTGVFDTGDGDGEYDREGGSERLVLDEGNPQLAFNGVNIDTWVRRIEVPLNSDLDQIETEITVRVPAGTNMQGNMLTVYPHPLGSVDITGVYTAPDLGDTFTVVSSFETVENAGPRRWYIPAVQIQQVRVRFRQRDWFEENGRKVFYVGAQEIGLYLVDWDKTWNSDGADTTNNSFLTRFDAPSGFAFKTLHLFRTNPDFTLEDAGSRHLHFKIATDEAMTDVRWTSDTDSLPQDTANGIVLGGSATSIYLLTVMNWVETSGGVGSPFPIATTPYLVGAGLKTTMQPV